MISLFFLFFIRVFVVCAGFNLRRFVKFLYEVWDVVRVLDDDSGNFFSFFVVCAGLNLRRLVRFLNGDGGNFFIFFFVCAGFNLGRLVKGLDEVWDVVRGLDEDRGNFFNGGIFFVVRTGFILGCLIEVFNEVGNVVVIIVLLVHGGGLAGLASGTPCPCSGSHRSRQPL